MARDLGCTIGELAERMDSREYALWLAHYAEVPDDGERIVFQIALLTACVINSLGSKRRVEPDDLIPGRRRVLKQEPWEVMKAKLALVAKARNKRNG
jgi:hypothetical protein